MRVAIGGKDWAEIKPVEELTRSDRKAVNAVIVIEADAASGRIITRASMDDEMAAAVMCRIISDWSFPYPPPGTDPKSLDRLPLGVDDELRKAIQPHLDAIRGSNAPSSDNEVPTPASAS